MMRSELEKNGARCARELAGLFDSCYSLTQRFIAEVIEGGSSDLSPFKHEWNIIHDDLVRIAPRADAIGAETINPTDQRFWSLATYMTCVPRMKVCVDLQLMALKIAMGCFDGDQADFALRVFGVMAEQFAPLVLACRDAPKLRLKHSEAASGFLKAITSRFDSELQPLHDQAAALIPLVEAGEGSGTT